MRLRVYESALNDARYLYGSPIPYVAKDAAAHETNWVRATRDWEARKKSRAAITRWLGNGAIARTPAHIGGPMNSLTIHDKVELFGIACLTVIGLLLLLT